MTTTQYRHHNINVDFTKDNKWQWHTVGHMQVCTLPQTGNHASSHHSFFTDRMTFLPPNRVIKY